MATAFHIYSEEILCFWLYKRPSSFINDMIKLNNNNPIKNMLNSSESIKLFSLVSVKFVVGI